MMRTKYLDRVQHRKDLSGCDSPAGPAGRSGNGNGEGEATGAFEGGTQDAAVWDYNPYRGPKTGRYTNGPRKSSTAKSKRDKLSMSNAERRRVSSGILTDHPDLQSGEKSDCFFDKHYYQFPVNVPGNCRFTRRIQIVGNESIIDLIRKKR